MEYLSIDRITGSKAVCVKDDMSTVVLSLSDLPKKIKEGCVVRLKNGKYIIDKNEEEKRRKRIAELQMLVFDDDD